MARAKAYKASYADSDSEPEPVLDNEATPKAKRTMGKRRVSEGYQPGADGSSPQRLPLMAVNINDDEAEKRRRRRSAKHGQPMLSLDEANSGESAQNGAGAADTPKALRQRNMQQLMTVAETPIINVPLDVMSSNFEEWMKMATDNKINATNSWNFALIDYFHDMSLLRNNGDNSINFQKASCTLDGCVKIWTSRVDSVGTETGKLLSNLASEGKSEGEDDATLSDNPKSTDAAQRKRAKPVRSESTLAKNVAQLRSKKLDLEFRVDPLFKKTCADFDEGGAQGLLMNHLSLGVGSEGSMRVIFDASDSMGRGQVDEDGEIVEIEPRDEIDIGFLRSEFIPDLSILDDKGIARSLERFSFSKDQSGFNTSDLFHANYAQGDDDMDDAVATFGNDAGTPTDLDGIAALGEETTDVQDFFIGDQAVDNNVDSGYPMGPDDREHLDGGDGGDGDDGVEAAPRAGFEPFDPKRVPNERDLVLAMTEPGANGGSLDYFDQTFLKNWAGPEHWKLRKVIRRPETIASTSANKLKQKEKREPFKIDFLTPSNKSQKEIAKEIFAPVKKGASITLPQLAKRRGKKGKEKRGEQTLPDDMHFSSRQLVTLFLKPKFALRIRGSRGDLNGTNSEIDENFWAQAAADQAAGRGDEGENGVDGATIPFNTQFFHDEYDDGPGFEDIYDGDGDGTPSAVNPDDAEPGEPNLLLETQGRSQRVRPEMVNYTRRAKRVDVRRLKENIWKGLDIVVLPSEDNEGEEISTPPETRPPTDPEESRQFTNVISDLQKSYPKDKMDEISTSFCFICLLHLANERGLKLEVGDDEKASLQNSDEDETKVGTLWDLKVYRDPTAMPSA